jgi:NADH dehydrogenase
VQVSAIGADENSTSHYARSKAEAERLVLEAAPSAVIMRPSIMFGPEDTFFNRFGAMARMLPALPLIGGGLTRFQPVFVGDVAAAIADAVDGKAKPGTIYELGGPQVFTFKELMQFTLDTIHRRRLLISLPFPLAKFKAMFLQFLPNAPLTPDQVEMLRTDNVVSEAASREGRTLQAFGITPESIAAIVPTYLWRFRKTGQFSRRPA